MLDICVILCTCSNESEARILASGAVTEQLAACVNILPGVESVYVWDGQVELQRECQLVFKTTQSAEPELRKWVFSKHSYTTPEWIVINDVDASSNYATWIRTTVK